eukprot:107178_1
MQDSKKNEMHVDVSDDEMDHKILFVDAIPIDVFTNPTTFTVILVRSQRILSEICIDLTQNSIEFKLLSSIGKDFKSFVSKRKQTKLYIGVQSFAIHNVATPSQFNRIIALDIMNKHIIKFGKQIPSKWFVATINKHWFKTGTSNKLMPLTEFMGAANLAPFISVKQKPFTFEEICISVPPTKQIESDEKIAQGQYVLDIINAHSDKYNELKWALINHLFDLCLKDKIKIIDDTLLPKHNKSSILLVNSGHRITKQNSIKLQNSKQNHLFRANDKEQCEPLIVNTTYLSVASLLNKNRLNFDVIIFVDPCLSDFVMAQKAVKNAIMLAERVKADSCKDTLTIYHMVDQVTERLMKYEKSNMQLEDTELIGYLLGMSTAARERINHVLKYNISVKQPKDYISPGSKEFTTEHFKPFMAKCKPFIDAVRKCKKQIAIVDIVTDRLIIDLMDKVTFQNRAITLKQDDALRKKLKHKIGNHLKQ